MPKGKYFPPKISNMARMTALITFIQHTRGFSHCNRQDKRKKNIQIGKEKVSLFAYDMTIYVDNSIKS